MTGWISASLVTFAVIFAVNSSIHSYLVVKYAEADKVAVSVGFYYMSNAMGRLMGTIGSGLLYTYVGGGGGGYGDDDYESMGDYAAGGGDYWGGQDGTAGLAACFLAGTLSSLAAAAITAFVDDDESGLRCGPCVCVDPKEVENYDADADDDFHDVVVVVVGNEVVKGMVGGDEGEA